MRRFRLFPLLAVLLCAASMWAASGTCGANVTWELDEGTGLMTISGTGAMEDFESYSTRVWNDYAGQIKSVVINDGVTSVGANAFYYCMSLTSVTLGQDVASIGMRGFMGCSGMTSFEFPAAIDSIGASAFMDCEGLTSITFHEGLRIIEEAAFYGCKKLASVSFPSSLTTIGKSAFYRCNKLTSIWLPANVTGIGSDAFCVCGPYDDSCVGLSSITCEAAVPPALLLNGKSVFNSTDIPLYVQEDYIPAYKEAFYWKNFSNIQRIVYPNGACGENGDHLKWEFNTTTGVLTISGTGNMASWASPNEVPWYQYTNDVTAVVLKDGVTGIGNNAFNGYSSVTSVTIPDGVTSIGNYAFAGWSSLKIMNLPEGVTTLGTGAFSGCSALDMIVLPQTVNTIGASALAGCSSLTSVTIPANVTSIGDRAFSGCTGLVTLTSQATVPPALGDNVFEGISTNIIPLHVPQAGVSAYSTAAQWKEFDLGVAPTSGQCGDELYWEYDIASGALTITGSGNMYAWASESAVPWRGYAASIKAVEFPQGLTSIGAYAFSQCIGLDSITIPDKVTFIGGSAFYGCFGLTDVYCYVKANEVTWVSYGSDFKQGKATTFHLPRNYYNQYVDHDLYKDANVTYTYELQGIYRGNCGPYNADTQEFADNLKWDYDEYAHTLHITGSGPMADFSGNPNDPNSWPWIGKQGLGINANEYITLINLPEGMTSIGNVVFARHFATKYNAIPSTVKTIGFSAFAINEALDTITIPASVDTIHYAAFEGCRSLRCVIFEDITPPVLKPSEDGILGFFLRSGDHINDDNNPKITIVVPEGCMDTYKAAPYYAKYFEFRAMPEYTVPEPFIDLAYNGQAQTLIKTAGTTTGGTFQYAIATGGLLTWTATLPVGTEMGEYKIYYRIVGDDVYRDINYNPQNYVTAFIGKATPVIEAPTAYETLTYTGGAQELVVAGTTTGGTMLYSLNGEEGPWSAELPKGMAPGEYTVYYRVLGGDNYNDIPYNADNKVQIYIAKAAPVVTAPEALELVYNGENQTLTTAGATTGGTLLYTLTPDDEESWATTLPAGLNAGEYTVYYKVKGNDNYLDAESASVIASIAKADIDLNGGGNAGAIGSFSISEKTKVGFALGNLQYQASSGTWRFAEHQWDAIGSANSNISDSYSGWIDLFGWGMAATEPAKNSTNGSDYLSSVTEHRADFGSENDWGTVAASHIGAGWRTMTTGEWVYLFNTRENASALRARATIHNVAGMIFLPDECIPAVALNTSLSGTSYATNTLSDEDWATLEAQGAIFLPAAGRRQGTKMYSVGEYGYYWSSTGEYATTALFARIDGEYGMMYPQNIDNRSHGQSVRLVAGASLTLPRAIEGLVYNGKKQTLVEAGESSEGTFFYSIDGENWADTLPKGLDAGDYNVYYKIQGDANHNDVPYNENHKVVVTIAKADIQLISIDGGFSFGANTKLNIAPGNLQYQASTDTWRFAVHQWDTIGNAAGNTTAEADRATQADWIDQFGWGTGLNPTYSEYEESEYATFNDWGAQLPASLGTWRTPTGDEWDYLFNTRANAANLRGKASVNGVNGLIILPDAWVAPDGVTFNADVDGEGFAEINSYTAAQWAVMEEAGAVFLPAGGNRWLNNVNAVGEYGYYWSASMGEHTPYSMVFSQWYESFMAKDDYNDRPCGMSVRLIGGLSADPNAPKAIVGLTTNGEPQTLITAGSSEERTYVYSLDGENWSAELPTGVDAKEYTVYYKIKGDNNHNDSEVGQLTAFIGTLPKAIEGLVYNGEPQTLIKGGEMAGYSFQYKVGEDGEWISELPAETNAGIYTVYYKASAEGEEDITGSVQATIAKADIDLEGGGDDPVSLTLPKAIEGLKYTGEKQTLIEAGESSDGTFLYSLDGENWADTLPKGLDAGKYNVYYKVQGDANHNDSEAGGPIEVTIAKSEPEYTEPEAIELTYTGEPQEPVVPGASEDGKFQYSPDGENWTDTVPKLKDAGEYSIYYRFVGDENHEDGEEESVINVVIAKAAPEFSKPTANEPTYTGEPQKLLTPGESEDGTFLYSMDGPEGPWSNTIPEGNDAGEYKVYFKLQGDDNHKDSELDSVIVTIAKAAPEFTAPVANEPTYTGEPQKLLTEGESEDGTFLYSIDGPEGPWSNTIPEGTDANEYKVYFKLQGDDNHKDSEPDSVIVTIAKAAPEFTAPEANEPTYNGEPQALIAEGESEDGTMLYSKDGENWSTEIPTATDAGEYTVYYKVQGDDNHKDSEPETVIVTIAKAAPEFTAPEANEPTYNEQPQALIAAGTTEDGTMLYSLDGENWSTEIPTATDAGEYTVYYKVQGDANHNDSEPESVNVTIAKAAPEFTAPLANEPTYNGEPQALIAAGTTEDGSFEYSMDGEHWSATIPTATNAGEYIVYYRVIGDANHLNAEDEEYAVTVMIAKAAPEFTAPEANEPTYNEQPQALIAAGTTEDGTMLYSLDGENWSTEIPTATNAGAYTVYYKVQGDDNHKDSEPESMTVTIAKATLSVSEVEVVKAKFADGNANARVTIHGVLNGVQGDDAITLTTTAAYDNAEVGNNKTITVSYTLTADAAVLANYDFPVTTEVYTTEGVIIEPMVPNNDATPETTDQEVKEGIEVNAYGFCHGESYSLGYHLKSGDPNQYKIEFPDSRFTDVDWTDLVINGASGRDGYIDINVPVDLPTGMYSMTVTFRRYIAFSDGSSISLESAPFTTSFNVNLPETYTMPLFDNVIALVDTCECLTEVQWYHREKSTDEWQLIPGATNYYYKQEGGLTGEYFAKVKMNGVETFTCPQVDVETLYGQSDAAAKQAKVSVYPNPVVTTATVTIEDSDTFDHVLRVVNGNGWQVEQREFEGMETTIDLTGCTVGHYMISVDGVVVKVIKK